jgi:hypothetical protein
MKRRRRDQRFAQHVPRRVAHADGLVLGKRGRRPFLTAVGRSAAAPGLPGAPDLNPRAIAVTPNLTTINSKPRSLKLSATSIADTASPWPRSTGSKPKTGSAQGAPLLAVFSMTTATVRKPFAPRPTAICSVSSPSAKSKKPNASPGLTQTPGTNTGNSLLLDRIPPTLSRCERVGPKSPPSRHACLEDFYG